MNLHNLKVYWVTYYRYKLPFLNKRYNYYVTSDNERYMLKLSYKEALEMARYWRDTREYSSVIGRYWSKPNKHEIIQHVLPS